MPTQPNRIKTHNGNVELFEMELTKSQIKALSSLLPKGFTLESSVKPQKEQVSSNPQKKLFTNEGEQVVQKPLKPIVNPQDYVLINKQALRDPGKRKVSSHLSFYHEYEQNPTTSSKAFRPSNEAVRKCYNLLQKLKKHPCSGPFLMPVDVVGLGLHDYLSIVREPIDLTTIENKLKNDEYSSVGHFIADIRKMRANAYLYNKPGSALYSMTDDISSNAEKLFKDIETLSFNDLTVRDLEKKVEMLSKQLTQLHQRGLSTASDYSKNSRSGNKTSKSVRLPEKPLTLQEKQLLGQNINKLPPEHLRGVWNIVSASLSQNGTNKEELEFDLESLPVSTARELERYVKTKMSIINRNRSKKSNENSALRDSQPASSNIVQHEAMYGGNDFEEDKHQVPQNEVIDFRPLIETKRKASPSNSSESSFISDSDGDDEDRRREKPKAMKSLHAQKELEEFVAGGHGTMIKNFIVK